MAWHELVDDYLIGWVLVAVAVGLLVPETAVVTAFSTPILAVMVGSVALTLTPKRFRAVDARGLGAVLLGHLAMPLIALAIARALALSPPLTAGFVLLAAVTPELITPTMTELAGGDTALASVALVGIGLGSTAFVPLVAAGLLAESVAVRPWAIVEQLLVAVVVPMLAAVTARARWDKQLAAHEEWFPSVSAVMVVLIIGGVAGANAGLVRENADLLVTVGAGALALNLAGYAVGWTVASFADRETRIAVVLSVGMRDFAVAAALVVSAGFPTAASLPAIVFGVGEMVTSTGLARHFEKSVGTDSDGDE